MDVARFGLGARFDLLYNEPNAKVEQQIWDKVFSVINISDAEGLMLFGHRQAISYSDCTQYIYTCIFTNGKLKQMRKLFEKLKSGIMPLLCFDAPFIETNALREFEHVTGYGKLMPDGTLAGGEAQLILNSSDISPLDIPKHKQINILLSPDSYKGTLSARHAALRLAQAARSVFNNARLMHLPVADGGEGTLDAIISACSGSVHEATVKGPYSQSVNAKYGVINSDTCVIESAQACGLGLKGNLCYPLSASSYGVGELIKRALDDGFKKIIIGLGGSATNDGGMGALEALGVKFLDESGNELVGCGVNMLKIKAINLAYLHPAVKTASFEVLCDVTNLMTGASGATRVYGPQKGADSQAIDVLECGMENLRRWLTEAVGTDFGTLPGSGAAGGMGAAFAAVLGAKLFPGTDRLLQMLKFEELLEKADIVVSGEGRFDSQSIEFNKAAGGILARCTKRAKPLAMLCGSISESAQLFSNSSNISIMTIVSEPGNIEELLNDPLEAFDNAARRMFKMIKIGIDATENK